MNQSPSQQQPSKDPRQALLRLLRLVADRVARKLKRVQADKTRSASGEAHITDSQRRKGEHLLS